MLFSTFLTLVIVPVVYTLLSRFIKSEEKSKQEKISSEQETKHKFDPVTVTDS
jgi:hypothetical protein